MAIELHPNADPASSHRFRETLVALIGPLYAPTFAASLGVGMLIPVLPLYLREGGFSYTAVTVVIAALGFGAVIGQLPAGWLMNRIGQTRLMVGSVLLLGGSTAVLGFTTMLVALVVFRLGSGAGATGWILSRQAFLSTHVATAARGRAAATVGGTVRAATLLGSLLGGWVAARFGFATAFAVSGAIVALAATPYAWFREGPSPVRTQTTSSATPMSGLVRRHWRRLWPAGLVQLCVIGAREGRLAVIPLLGAALGLDVAQVGVLVAVGAASDLLLFPLSGWLMDRYGRQTALVPFLAIFGMGLIAAGLATTPAWLVFGAAVVGFGNGLGAGTMLTMGADLAPADDTARFLSVLGLTRESGRVVGPLAVGAVADAIGIGPSAVVLGLVAFLAMGLVVTVLGDTGVTAALEESTAQPSPPRSSGPATGS